MSALVGGGDVCVWAKQALPLMPISKTAIDNNFHSFRRVLIFITNEFAGVSPPRVVSEVSKQRHFVTEYIAEYKDWSGAPAPCPYRTEPQWAVAVAYTAETYAA